MNGRILASLLAAALGLGSALPAAGGVIFYSDRTTWLAAIGAPTFSEDFSGFASDTSFQTSAVALDGLSIAQVGSDNFRNEIDVGPPFDFTEHNGSNHASIFTNASGGSNPAIDVQLSFDQANVAFGLDSWVAADQEGARLEIYDGVTLLGSQDLTNGFGDFLGYVLDGGDSATSALLTSITSITSPGDPGEGYGIDDLAGVAVPEPGTLPLLVLGLAALARARRYSAASE